jgi:uncharacterized membrane protein
MKEFFARSIQLLIVIGFIAVFFNIRSVRSTLPAEFVLLAAGSLLSVAALVVIPVLSVEYGILRAFQQSLLFLSVFAVIGFLTLCIRFKNAVIDWLLFAFVIGFFLSSTGVFVYVTGGYQAPLHLSNSGLYYDLFYIRNGEAEGYVWLANELKTNPGDVQSESQIDPLVFTGLDHITDPNPFNTIYPGLIRKDSYVFLNYANVHKRRSVIEYNDTYVTYEYPIEFLQATKKLVYDNGIVQIYK